MRRKTRNRISRSHAEVAILADARSGDRIEVVGIDDGPARIAALRFGMAEGAHLSCVVRIPAGPIVVRTGRQEIAVGRALAERIRVRCEPGCARRLG